MSKKYKREAAKMKEISSLVAAQPEEIRTRRQAAEETYSGITNRLGAKGTYENVGGASPTSSLTGAASAQTGAGPDSPQDNSIFKTEKAKSANATDVDPRYSGKENIQDITSLDSEKTIKNLEGSSQFRIMSRLTAESEQLLARDGELYDEMEKNLQNPIIEGAGALARENAAEIKRMMAKGGSARRGAFEAVEKIRQQNAVNQQRVTAINQSRFQLDQWARTNARTNLEFGQNWASNVGGVRESFNAAMDNASELMTTQALPLMMQAQEKAAAYRRAAHEATQSGVVRWVKGIVGAVMMYASGGSSGGTLLEGAMQGSGAAVKPGDLAGGGQGTQGMTPYEKLKGGINTVKKDAGSIASDIGGLLGIGKSGTGAPIKDDGQMSSVTSKAPGK